MLASLTAQQITGNYLFFLIQSGFTLGGIIGAIMGSIGYSLSERGNRALATLMLGGVFGLFLGLFMVGGTLLSTFSSMDALFMNANQASNAAFRSALGVLWFTLVGAAIGGAVSSLGRALIGTIAGLAAGTFAGIILVLLNLEFGFRVTGPIATMLVGIATLLLLVISLSGSEKHR